MKNKIIKTVGIVGIVLLMATGCNKSVWDTNYTYNYAECYLGGEYQRYEIKKWSDYDGEQIQVITKDDRTYLLSMNYCRLVNE